MKITIELDDQILKDAVMAQVSAALAEYTAIALNERAATIIATKLDRFNAEQAASRTVAEEVRKCIGGVLDSVLGRQDYERRAAVKAILTDAIKERVHEAFKP